MKMKSRVCTWSLVVALMVTTVFFATDIRSDAATTLAKAEQLLNSITLNPQVSGNVELDAVIQSVLAQIISPNMSTYQKVKACYDYLITHSSYGTRGEVIYIPQGWDSNEYIAYQILTTGVGVCDHYSAAFAYMMRAIGIENSFIDGGYAGVSGGGYRSHAWAIIRIGGVHYVFDPQIEDNIAKGGTIKYYRFCKTYNELGKNYSYTSSGAPITENTISANGTSTVYTTMRCSIWNKPLSKAENRVKYVDELYAITIYPDPVFGADGKAYFKTITGNYVLAKCVW